jgi:hypothetical protein
MKKILFASIVGLSVLSFNIQAAEPAKKPEIKRACVTQKDPKTVLLLYHTHQNENGRFVV